MLRYGDIVAAINEEVANPDNEGWLRENGLDPEDAMTHCDNLATRLVQMVAMISAGAPTDDGRTPTEVAYEVIVSALMGQMALGYRLGVQGGPRDSGVEPNPKLPKIVI